MTTQYAYIIEEVYNLYFLTNTIRVISYETNGECSMHRKIKKDKVVSLLN
jgi:hypothetical protein